VAECEQLSIEALSVEVLNASVDCADAFDAEIYPDLKQLQLAGLS
jgi:hypothetical protein